MFKLILTLLLTLSLSLSPLLGGQFAVRGHPSAVTMEGIGQLRQWEDAAGLTYAERWRWAYRRLAWDKRLQIGAEMTVRIPGKKRIIRHHVPRPTRVALRPKLHLNLERFTFEKAFASDPKLSPTVRLRLPPLEPLKTETVLASSVVERFSGAGAGGKFAKSEAVAVVPQTYFVRTGGDDSCTGLNDVDFTSGTACAKATPQAAVTAAACGDTVQLLKGQTWDGAPVITVNNKACTLGSPLTIQSSGAASLPSTARTSSTVSAGDQANMARVRGTSGSSVILINGTSAHITIDGLDITANCTGATYINSGIAFEAGSYLTVKRSWIHPPETTGVVRTMGRGFNIQGSNVVAKWNIVGMFTGVYPAPIVLSGALDDSATTINVVSTALIPASGTGKIDDETFTYTGVAGGNTLTGVTRGFGGSTAAAHSDGATGVGGMTLMDSEAFAAPSSPGPIEFTENYLGAYFAAWFTGGGDTLPAHTATLSAVSGTASATLSDTTGITAGLILRLALQGTGSLVGNTLTYASGTTLEAAAIGDGMIVTPSGGGTTYYNSYLSAVSGADYTYTNAQGAPNGNYDYTLYQTVMVDTVNHGTGEVTWTPYGINALSKAPTSPGEAAWSYGDESLVANVTVQRNTVEMDSTFGEYWVTTVGGFRPKGYCEIKNVSSMTVSGNHFIGYPTAIAFFATSQAGTAPWITVKDVTIESNYFHPTITAGGTSIPFFVALDSAYYTTTPGSNLIVRNNLAIKQGNMIQSSGGRDVEYSHNTIITTGTQPTGGYNSMLTAAGITLGTFTFRDNVVFYHGGGIQCGVDPFTLAACFPGTRDIRNNIVVDDQSIGGITADLWGTASIIPVANYAAVLFTNYNSGAYGGDFSLQAGSPGHNAATDGADVGVNWATLNAALAGGAPVSLRGLLQMRGRVTIR